MRYSASQAPYIRERTWHPSQKIETEPDGSIILTLKVADLGEVKFWLIGFGAEAEVLSRPSCAMTSRRSALELSSGSFR
ncbi:MAG: WYL domain-containing protein [Terriglobia bacterium]